MKFGVTFSEPYAHSLGLSPVEVFRSLTSEIRLRAIRLCVYWDRAEPLAGKFDFDSLDRQVDEAARTGLDIILAFGQKAPRWPEFHRPAWTSPHDPDFEQYLMRMVETVVRHFSASSVSTWQVENEPFMSFGGPPIKEDLLRRQVDLVRSLDGRPIMLTDSADKGRWARASKLCDVLGVNLYTRVWNGRRYADIDVARSEYERRIRSVPIPVVVSELQAEPWGPKPVAELTTSEAAVTMNPERLWHNVELATNAGFATALFWGCEWWYWLRERGDPSMWDAASEIVEQVS
jgi:GH35 family endo-1,4-beta-xylanase